MNQAFVVRNVAFGSCSGEGKCRECQIKTLPLHPTCRIVRDGRLCRFTEGLAKDCASLHVHLWSFSDAVEG